MNFEFGVAFDYHSPIWQQIQHEDQERLDQLHPHLHPGLLQMDMEEEWAVTQDQGTLLETVLFLIVCLAMIVFMGLMV